MKSESRLRVRRRYWRIGGGAVLLIGIVVAAVVLRGAVIRMRACGWVNELDAATADERAMATTELADNIDNALPVLLDVFESLSPRAQALAIAATIRGGRICAGAELLRQFVAAHISGAPPAMPDHHDVQAICRAMNMKGRWASKYDVAPWLESPDPTLRKWALMLTSGGVDEASFSAALMRMTDDEPSVRVEAIKASVRMSQGDVSKERRALEALAALVATVSGPLDSNELQVLAVGLTSMQIDDPVRARLLSEILTRDDIELNTRDIAAVGLLVLAEMPMAEITSMRPVERIARAEALVAAGPSDGATREGRGDEGGEVNRVAEE